jgi:uncharacterized protein YdeI (YjbR/CyaY-like superfamily)
MHAINPAVEEFINKLTKWQQELEQLRMIVLDCGLVEQLKWGQPCYMYGKSNVLMIAGFKDNCVISFFKGSLLSDSAGLLVKPGDDSQSFRLIRFRSVEEVVSVSHLIKTYIFEAIEVEKAGLVVPKKPHEEYVLPDELLQKFKEVPRLQTSFEALTPGRQRAYILHFSSAKQSATRIARIESYKERILSGKGIGDCVCGMSKKMPGCDGSHKYL